MHVVAKALCLKRKCLHIISRFRPKCNSFIPRRFLLDTNCTVASVSFVLHDTRSTCVLQPAYMNRELYRPQRDAETRPPRSQRFGPYQTEAYGFQRDRDRITSMWQAIESSSN